MFSLKTNALLLKQQRWQGVSNSIQIIKRLIQLVKCKCISWRSFFFFFFSIFQLILLLTCCLCRAVANKTRVPLRFVVLFFTIFSLSLSLLHLLTDEFTSASLALIITNVEILNLLLLHCLGKNLWQLAVEQLLTQTRRRFLLLSFYEFIGL